MKLCSKCGERERMKGRSTCAPCWAAYMRDYRARNPEKRLAGNAAVRAARLVNPPSRAPGTEPKHCSKCGQTKAAQEFYPNPSGADGRRSYCRSCGNVAARAWRRANPERAAEHRRRSRKKWYAKNRARVIAAATDRTRWIRRVKRHPESGPFLNVLLNDPCAYCGSRGGRMTIDHIVPVVEGGTHGPDNLTGACYSCNSSKQADSLLLFMLRVTRPRRAT